MRATIERSRPDTMTQIKLGLNPFQTPNYVSVKRPPRPRQDGWQESPTIPLRELDEQALSELCDAFRAEVFKKAGKQDPRQQEQAEAERDIL